MDNSISLKGIIYKVNATEEISDKFRKRSFILQLPGQYPQYPKLEVVKDKCELLDKFSVGQEVEVAININGRLYNSKQTGEEDAFTTLQAWKINASAEAPADMEAGSTHNWQTADEGETTEGDGTGLPF